MRATADGVYSSIGGKTDTAKVVAPLSLSVVNGVPQLSVASTPVPVDSQRVRSSPALQSSTNPLQYSHPPAKPGTVVVTRNGARMSPVATTAPADYSITGTTQHTGFTFIQHYAGAPPAVVLVDYDPA
jgi:hypothetical protein